MSEPCPGAVKLTQTFVIGYATDCVIFHYFFECYFTQKPGDNKLYMIVFNIPISKALKLKLPEKTTIADNALLTDSRQKFRIEKIYGNEYYLHLGDAKFTQPFVITLLLKKD